MATIPGFSACICTTVITINISEDLRLKIAYMPLRLRGTVLTWLVGLEPYFAMSRETYYRHYRLLRDDWQIDIKKPPNR